MKHPKTYYKAHGPGGWDFDTLMDYVHSMRFGSMGCVHATEAHVVGECRAPRAGHATAIS